MIHNLAHRGNHCRRAAQAALGKAIQLLQLYPALHHFKIASDDPDDLTLKAARLLGQADEIWHQTAIAPAILHRARADAKRVPSETPPPDSAATVGRIIIWLTKG